MNATERARISRRHAAPADRTASLLRRAAVQLEFARELIALEPGLAGHAETVRGAARKLEESTDLEATLSEIETDLAPLGEVAKTYTVHLVGHGHIDMNWMWSWPETVAATHDTFASVLGFMRRDPDLTFTQSQASVYAIMARYHPTLFEEIRTRVREGRWEVTATQWVEGDKNIVSGESLARHMLYSRAASLDWFGLSPEDAPVAWEPDTFGHANTIPTILKAGGIRYYYSCRTGGGHGHARVGPERPALFWWEGPDGARLLVNRETTWYNSYVHIGENFALPMLSFARATGLKRWMNVFGIGNHGGGPTAVELAYLRETMTWPIFPTVEFGTAKGYFEAIEGDVRDDLPVLRQELNYEFTGCYTSESAIKRAHRLGESGALDAEAANVVAKALNVENASGPGIREAWLPVLFSQFHDILTGSGVEATRMHAVATLHESAAISGAAMRRLATALAARVDTLSLLPDTQEGGEERDHAETGFNNPFQAGPGVGAGESGFSPSSGGGVRYRPFVVWNPCAWTRDALIEVHLWDSDLTPGRIVATDETGRSLPTLVTRHGSQGGVDWDHQRTSVVFTAERIPGLGYRTYLLHEGEPSPDAPTVTAGEGGHVQADGLDIRVDRYGLGLFDPNGAEIGGWSAVIEKERGMTSWVVGDETRVGPVAADGLRMLGASAHPGSGVALESPVAAIVALRKARVPNSDTTISLRTTVPPLGRRVEFEAEIEARDVGTPAIGIPGLTVDFRPGREDTVVFETPHGSIARPNDGPDPRTGEALEVPTFRYTHLPNANLTIFQDGRSGFVMEPDGVRMRAIRASFDPDPTPEVGTRRLRYAVVFHEEAPSRTDLARLAAEFQHPLIAFPATLQSGSLPTTRGLLEVEGAAVSAVKLGEKGGLILRLVGYEDEARPATARFDPSLAAKDAPVARLDLIERELPAAEGDPTKLNDGILTARVPAGAAVTYRIG